MVRDYPDYYKTFSCIGGECKDSCCIGWEVDIDNDTWEYYSEIEGEFGERLRSHMTDDGEDRFFPMCENGRCPFLNDKNLCDIFSEIGEESLSQVCTEYPRYYLEAGDYQQIDLSLSCMELGRIFFGDPDPIKYIHEEDMLTDEPLDPLHHELLMRILTKRDQLVTLIQNRDLPLADRILALKDQLAEFDTTSSKETWNDLLTRMDTLDVIDERWTRAYAQVKEHLSDCLAAHGSAQTLVALMKQASADYDVWAEKLVNYFLFRYVTDGYFTAANQMERDLPEETTELSDDSWNFYVSIAVGGGIRIALRALRFITAQSVIRLDKQEGNFTVDDMIDIAHLYSKEVEHSEDNVAILKLGKDTL